MKEKVKKLMEEQIIQMEDDLEIIKIFRSNDKYVGVLGYRDKNISKEAYENVLIYDTRMIV